MVDMAPKKCENCDEMFDDTNGLLTEDGKYSVCSDGCLSQLEEDLAENAREESNLRYAYRTGRT